MNLKKIAAISAAAAMAAVASAGVANANANAYVFAYTYAPYDTGYTQTLILNGTTDIQASFTGWYDYTGLHQSGNPDYIAGNCSLGACGGAAAYNDFFVFDLSGVSGPITSAQLSIGNPGAPYPGYSGAASATYSNYDVTTPIATLEAGNTGATGIYNDLGSGVLYAATGVSTADNGTQVLINLDADALTALNAAEGGQWAVGGTLGTFSAGVPEPTTWAMFILGIFGVGAMLRSRKSAVAGGVAA